MKFPSIANLQDTIYLLDNSKKKEEEKEGNFQRIRKFKHI